MKRLITILIWSAISAAFIGPGTVTTAAKSGAQFQLHLLWALLFSTTACLFLQEASARLTIVSGQPLAQALGRQFKGNVIPWVVVISVVLGCAAYQAGNILGAVAGVSLGLKGINPKWFTVGAGLIAGLILMAGAPKMVARILGLVVAMMGAAFLACAIKLGPDLKEALKGAFVPNLPENSSLLVLGLIGTTVVPYNLFLGSGLAKGLSLGQSRFGLAVAIPLGGLISMGILVAGTSVQGEFSFQALSCALTERLGGWAAALFSFGLFAAGLSSAITAPLAAGLCVKGLANTKKAYQFTWIGVLLFGLILGLLDLKPIPIILLAQALNGVILPVVALFLWIAINDRKLMGNKHLCGPIPNIFLGISVFVTFILGASNILKAAFSALQFSPPSESLRLITGCALGFVFCAPILRQIYKRRKP